jgi:hypothetical protein
MKSSARQEVLWYQHMNACYSIDLTIGSRTCKNLDDAKIWSMLGSDERGSEGIPSTRCLDDAKCQSLRCYLFLALCVQVYQAHFSNGEVATLLLPHHFSKGSGTPEHTKKEHIALNY